MKPNDLHGVWRVVEHKLSDSTHDDYDNIMESFDQFCLKGMELVINQNGYMSWNGCSNFEMHPYLKAKRFTIAKECEDFFIWMFVGKGSVKIAFKIDLEKDVMILQHKHGFILELQKIFEKTPEEKPFSLCDALNNEDFKDLEIVSKNGKKFYCHKCILSSVFMEENWEDGTNFLSGATEDVIAVILHYTYCACLPSWLDSNCAQELLRVLQETTVAPSNFLITIDAYLKCLDSRNALQVIMQDFESSLTNIVHLVIRSLSIFSNYASSNSTEEIDKLIENGKLILQEVILGLFSIILWCKTYTESKNILTMKMRNNACQEVIKLFTKFCKDLKGKNRILLSTLKMVSLDSLSMIPETLLPEFEALLQPVLYLYMSWTNIVKNIFGDLVEANAKDKAKQKGPKFFWGLYNEMVFSDMTNLYDLKEGFHCKIYETVELLKDAGASNRSQKKEILSRLLREAVKRLVIDILPQVDYARDEGSFFKLEHAASRVSCILEKIKQQKSFLSVITTVLKDFMCRDSFNNLLKNIGLVELEGMENESFGCDKNDTAKSFAGVDGAYLNEAAPAERNFLSKCLEKLLENGQLSDLKYIVTNGSGDTLKFNEEVVFKAHRIVVASRSKWFQRALASGMKESIDRIFYIKDCSPAIFMKFLRYLYVGFLDDIDQFSEETLADLMTTADRYEVDDLREICESLLILKITEDNINFLESFADNILARRLKVAIASYRSKTLRGKEGDAMNL